MLSSFLLFCQIISIYMSKSCQLKSQKDGIFKEIYTCTCRKQYESFPALYLHNKTKHNITIHTRDKLKMKKKSVWSGNKKKIVYQFSSDVELEEKTDSRQSNKTKLRSSERFKNRNEQEQLQSQQLTNIINEFLDAQTSQNEATIPKQTLHDIFLYFADFFASKKVFEIVPQDQLQNKIKNKIEILPYYLNPFIIDYFPLVNNKIGMSEQILLKKLQKFSGWLYQKKYSQIIAVLNYQDGQN